MSDLSSKRVGSRHEELVTGGCAVCPECGPIELSNKCVNMAWHADSFEGFDPGCYCPECGKMHTKRCIAGGRCLGCGTMLRSEGPAESGKSIGDEDDEEYCAECGETLMHDPDGSPGVFVHASRELDNDHDPIPDSLDGANYGAV